MLILCQIGCNFFPSHFIFPFNFVFFLSFTSLNFVFKFVNLLWFLALIYHTLNILSEHMDLYFI